MQNIGKKSFNIENKIIAVILKTKVDFTIDKSLNFGRVNFI